MSGIATDFGDLIRADKSHAENKRAEQQGENQEDGRKQKFDQRASLLLASTPGSNLRIGAPRVVRRGYGHGTIPLGELSITSEAMADKGTGEAARQRGPKDLMETPEIRTWTTLPPAGPLGPEIGDRSVGE
jgi:hypothetical protein